MISLIVGSLGRVGELRRLLGSLERQTYRDFEVVLIDQSGTEALVSVAADFPGVEVRRVVAQPGLSRARNLGLSLARGEIVGFPDDDSWYPPGLLAEVAKRLAAPGVDGVSFRVTDEAGVCSAGGWMSAGRMAMTRGNVWRTAVSCSFFLRREAIGDVRFDERLGAGSGTAMGSGEETDFLLRLLGQGRRIDYDGTVTVFHPVFHGPWRARRGWRYGVGHGWVLRRHGFGVARCLWAVALQGVRAAQAAVTLRWGRVAFHLAQAVGRLTGFVRGGRAPGWAWPLVWAVAAWVVASAFAWAFNLSYGDAVNRYALMAEAFAQGDWAFAFHPRFNLLFPLGAGTLAWLGFEGTVACSIMGLLGWALSAVPLFGIAQSVFNRQAAWCAFVLCFISPILFDAAYEGCRDTFRSLAVFLAVYACLMCWDGRPRRAFLSFLLSLPFFALTRGDTILLGGVAWLLYACFDRFRWRTWVSAAAYAVMLQPGCWLTWSWTGVWLPSGQIAGAFLRIFGGGAA
ncbi:MAG TPA: glycosyltransferase family 2 protein [Candidatus Spyradenecus faecavium]|uniref:Glycosyltransferase family 2 protein n=1 Tax=Candidatus Spyradenecus faecavium TaxID=2840947 RepID=A0A9D1NNE1_9BACT|nr:glycosyltransferase family 2 protein [Candidatus Spyradenecus faecavium]